MRAPDLGQELWAKGFRGRVVVVPEGTITVAEYGSTREMTAFLYGERAEEKRCFTLRTQQTVAEIIGLIDAALAANEPVVAVGDLAPRPVKGQGGEVYRVISGRLRMLGADE